MGWKGRSRLQYTDETIALPKATGKGIKLGNPESQDMDWGWRDITSSIETTSNVNINIEGDYSVTYRVFDKAGNLADTFRVVKIRVFK